MMNTADWLVVIAIFLPLLISGIGVVATLRSHVGNLEKMLKTHVAALEKKVDTAVNTIEVQVGGLREELHGLTAELVSVRVNEARDLERFQNINRRIDELVEKLKEERDAWRDQQTTQGPRGREQGR